MLPRALQGKRALIAGGIATYVGASYAAYSFLKKDKPGGAPSSPPTAAVAIASHNNAGTWDSLAASYDSAVDYDETFMGIKLLRRWLVKSAKGRVLEVSAGTGRNLPYYHLSPPPDPDACCVTITDRSTEMLGASQAKASKLLGPTSGEAGCLTFTAADATALPFPDDSFDTVVQTFGLCSESDPARALAEMQRVCRPGGTILLLEHGRSGYFSWLNGVLDKSAPDHAAKWGCWWNKDITALLEASGLQLLSYHTWHFGTTHYVVARPRKAAPGPSGRA